MKGVLDNEELLWKQKSYKDWLAFGDHNTKYFHSKVNKRRRVNQFTALKLDHRTWCYDEERLKLEVVSFCSHLYIADESLLDRFPLQDCFPTIDSDWLTSLSKDFTPLEVYEVLFEMVSLEALGIDGLHAQFYQTQWNVVGDSMVTIVRKGFENGVVES